MKKQQEKQPNLAHDVTEANRPERAQRNSVEQAPVPTDQQQKYVDWLMDSERKSQEDYDKTLLTLSSAALGLSLTFVKDILGDKPIVEANSLRLAWLSWVVSVTAVLLSYYFSRRALRKALDEISAGKWPESTPGGWFRRGTELLNVVSGILFLLGLIFMGIFVSNNLR